jgi:regulator of sigma E protease
MAWLTVNFAWLTMQFEHVVSFLVLLTVLVFVHELGHYLVARWNGVRVEIFSIGFGPELFGWNDRAGTRWKFSTVPLGGYVKMYGDADPTSMPGEHLPTMTAAQQAVSFHHKRLGQRAAVVAAGPIANFILAVVILTGIIAIRGEQFLPPEVGQLVSGGAAEAAGVKPGDVIVSIDGDAVESFDGIKRIVEINTGTPLDLVVKRDGQLMPIQVTPKMSTETDRLGFPHQVALLGIRGKDGEFRFIHRDPLSAGWYALKQTWTITATTLKGIWQMILGSRSSDDVAGPIGIFQLSGAVAQDGLLPLIYLAAMLSINLGLINLFPIPVLDGGHLLFYAAEAIRGKPLSQRVQEYGFRLGLALVLMLMVFATWKDLMRNFKSWSS